MGTVIVALVLAAVVFFILWGMRRDKKQGKTSCGGSCGSCGACSGCAGCAGCGSKTK